LRDEAQHKADSEAVEVGERRSRDAEGVVEPLHVALERDELPTVALPEELRRLYGGDLRLAERTVFANFVETIDGVVAIPSLERSNALISGHEADRFVMGLLRAVADAVLIGCGTAMASPKGRWKAHTVFPPTADAFGELRRSLGHQEDARVAIVTGRGSVDPSHPAVRDGALIVTTQTGADRLAGLIEPPAEVAVVAGDTIVDPRAAIELLHERGYERILSEAGPRLFASLAREGLIDDLFLTVSPLLAGRGEVDKLGLIEGADLLPDTKLEARLDSVRIADNHLFLRYALT
jgi:riboflavin biosynthesis pyrimidine reductase